MDAITGGRHKPGEVGVQSHLKIEKNLRAQCMPFTISVVNEVKTDVAWHDGTDKSHEHATTIDRISDDVLLEIFDVWRSLSSLFPIEEWHTLVHVCRRWRQIVFESPHRLNLRILCKSGSPVRKNLCIWPALPILIEYPYLARGITPSDEDNVIAALEKHDRVCFIALEATGSQLEKMAAVMQKPFPLLTNLVIASYDGSVPTLPTEFLQGSAPCLQVIDLRGIPPPALPTLLLSASALVRLHLSKIPPTGYIPPEAMVTCLAALPRLEILTIEFRLPTPCPDRKRLLPETRIIMPALVRFRFRGAGEYLEDLTSQIHGPQLNGISIVYLNRLVDTQDSELSKFIVLSVGPRLGLFKHTRVAIFRDKVSFRVYCPENGFDCARTIVSCQGIDWQGSHIAQALSQLSATVSHVVHLNLKGDREVTDLVDWQLLFRQFSNAKTLRVSQKLAGRVALAFEDISEEMVTEVVPSLGLIRLVGRRASSVNRFIAARRISNCPVIVVDTKTDFDKRFESYTSE